jgi:hypothetical protein
MTEYRLYRVDDEGHIQGPPVIVSCDDDDAAIAQAKQYVDGVSIEVWDRARRIVRIPVDVAQYSEMISPTIPI